MLDGVALGRQLHQPLFVFAQSQPFVQQAVDLPLQFARRPVVLERFDFIKSAGFRFIDTQKRPIVRP